MSLNEFEVTKRLGKFTTKSTTKSNAIQLSNLVRKHSVSGGRHGGADGWHDESALRHPNHAIHQPGHAATPSSSGGGDRRSATSDEGWRCNLSDRYATTSLNLVTAQKANLLPTRRQPWECSAEWSRLSGPRGSELVPHTCNIASPTTTRCDTASPNGTVWRLAARPGARAAAPPRARWR